MAHAASENTTLTSTSNYNQAHVDRWLHDQLLKIGERDVLFERFAKRETMPQGLGNVVSWLRYNRLDLPTGTLTEGHPPGATQLALERVTTTLSQYGIVVTLSDRLQIETNHDVLRVAVNQVAETIAQLRDKLYIEALLGGTNAVYSGTSNSARSDLAAGDVLDTEDILRMVDVLETTDNVAGRAFKFTSGPAAGTYALAIHSKVALDLRQDTDFLNAVNEQDIEALRGSPFKVYDWQGVRIFVTNYLPEFENIGDYTADTRGDDLDDGAVTYTDGGGSLGDFISTVVTAKHLKRGFEEKISAIQQSGDLANGDDSSVTVTAPSNSSYVYSLYVGDDASSQANADGNLALAQADVDAGTAFDEVTSSPSGDAPPDRPASGVKVYPSFMFGMDAFGGVDMSGGALSAGFAQRGRTKDDPLDQITKVGAKMYFAALLLNDNWVVRGESASAFST